MYKILLLVSLIVCQLSVGDCNARVRYPRKVNHRAAPVRKEQPQRRTFISALLMAEINYLEGLLADQQSGRKPSKKPSPGKHQAPPKHHPAKGQYQVSKPEKYVSKLDPFHMIAAPDLTKEEAKETHETKDSYAVAAAETTTKKYGELEHYNLKGYLPPAKEDQVTGSYATPAPAYAAPAPANTYQLVKAPAAPSYAAQEFSYEAPAPAPAYTAPAPAPAPAYAAPATTYPQPQPAYSAAPAAAQPPAYEAPLVQPPSYQQNSHPLTFFHEAQASAVHETGADSAAAGTGEWPTVYYNTFDGSKKTLIL